MLKKVKEYKIYRLVLDGQTVYVGQTTQEYLSDRKSSHNYNKTFERIKESIIELIEITNDKTREQYWIEYYINEGCELSNKYKGHSGLIRKEYDKEWRKTEKCKEYQKKYRKEYQKTEEYKKRHKESQKKYMLKKKLEKQQVYDESREI